MTNGRDNLAQAVTGHPSVNESSLDELRALVERYPYYAPAQFLLLQKLKAADDPDASLQHSKAILYYPDPLLFDYFLSSSQRDDVAERVSVAPEDNFPLSAPLPEPAPAQEVSERLPSEGLQGEETTGSGESPDIAPANEEEDIPEPVAEDVAAMDVADVSTDERAGVKDDGGGNTQPHQPVESNGIHQGVTPPAKSDDPPAVTLEPYHTVDYFASQGIKAAAETFGNDKLDKGLKSFTDWLRTLKRMPAAELPKTPDATSEGVVVAMANNSVNDSNVVTEAMAEVWAKQGAIEKAEDIYRRLSLSDPSKTAYFAAKIENLKSV